MSRSNLVFVLLTLACGVASADVWRWVDEHGEPHYTDRWVPGSQLIKSTHPHPEQDSPSPASVSGGSRGGPDASSPSSAAGRDGLPNDAAGADAVKKDVSRAREARCKDLKDAYAKALVARRITKPAKPGAEPEYLSDEEADAYRVQLRSQVQEYCGSVPAAN